jgi:hypothetical protein
MNKLKLYYEDRLVSIWRRDGERGAIKRGKRVARDCPLSAEERRVYVKQGSLFCLKLMIDTRKIGLAEATKILNDVRGGSYKELQYKQRYHH